MEKILLYVSTSSNDVQTNLFPDSDLKELVESIESIEGIIKDTVGQKGMPGIDIFAVEIAKVGLISKLAEVIGGWLIKDRRRHLKLKIADNEIEVFDVDAPTQEQLIEWFKKQASPHIINPRD
jgi:hypothetical protein